MDDVTNARALLEAAQNALYADQYPRPEAVAWAHAASMVAIGYLGLASAPLPENPPAVAQKVIETVTEAPQKTTRQLVDEYKAALDSANRQQLPAQRVAPPSTRWVQGPPYVGLDYGNVAATNPPASPWAPPA